MHVPGLMSTATLIHGTDDRRSLTVDIIEIAKSADGTVLLEPVGEELPTWVRLEHPVVLRQAVRKGLHTWEAVVIQLVDDGARAWIEFREHELEERRQSPRVVLHADVEFQRMDGSAPVLDIRSADISETGIRLLGSTDLVAGEQLMLSIFLPGGVATTAAEIVGVHGDIVRIRFLALHRESQQRIRDEVTAGLLAQQCELARDPDEALDAFREMLDANAAASAEVT